MERIDSLDNAYKRIQNLGNIENSLLWISIVFSLISPFCESVLFVSLYIVLVIVFFTISIIKEIYFQYVGGLRITNCIEESFGNQLDSNVETKGYYDNFDKKGIDAFNLNVFYSIFITKRNASGSFIFKLTKYVIMFVVYILTLALSNPSAGLIVTQVVFGSGVLLNVVKEIYYVVSINSVYQKCDEIYVTKKYTEKNSRAKLLSLGFKYEKIKSYSNIMLSSKRFKKMNEIWTAEWEAYKSKCQIKM